MGRWDVSQHLQIFNYPSIQGGNLQYSGPLTCRRLQLQRRDHRVVVGVAVPLGPAAAVGGDAAISLQPRLGAFAKE